MNGEKSINLIVSYSLIFIQKRISDDTTESDDDVDDMNKKSFNRKKTEKNPEFVEEEFRMILIYISRHTRRER